MIGQTVKNYTIEELLGKGGMGAVYRARDLKLDRYVALKVLPRELMRDEERRRRFVQEAKAASAVNHPAIAQIYEIEEDAEISYIAMEYVDGATVRQLIERDELDLLAAIEVSIQVGDALARAHEAGIVHRDIKSDNIMVTRDGHPKVLDFGLAKLLDVNEPDDPDATMANTATLTQAGIVVGTVAYMSPEQARGLQLDHRSDVFSFGVVLYEMSTGRLPFQGQSALDTMHAIAFGDTQPIQALRSGLPYSLQRIVDRCLRKDPDERYANLDEAVNELKLVRREVETGSGSGPPLLERLRSLPFSLPKSLPVPRNLTSRGLVVIGFWTIVLLSVSVITTAAGGLKSSVWFIVVALMVYGNVRGRRRRQVRWFVKKVKKIKEVQMVGYQNDGFTVAVAKAKAKTFLRLNALLESANAGLYQRPPFTMQVREDVPAEELRELIKHGGARYVRGA